MNAQETTEGDYLLDDFDGFKEWAQANLDHSKAYEVIQQIENWPSVQDARARRTARAATQPASSL